MKTTRCTVFLGCLGASAVLTAALSGLGFPPVQADEPAKPDPALKEARDEAKMLDELYKTAVVSITEKYPRGQPAIMVAKDIFKAMENGRYHTARLVDVTGTPLGEGNVPKTGFEKRAAQAIKKGETYVEEVVGQGDNRTLLVATVVPAVHRRCAECHAVEMGDLLGFISYKIPMQP